MPPIDWWQGYHANYITLNSYDIRMQPFYFLYGGWIYPGSIHSTGAHGVYWSSTVDSIEYSYYLDLYPSDVFASGNYGRYDGFSIRCLAR